MNIATTLLKAGHIGVRELRGHLSKFLKENKPLIITEHGTPTKAIISYQDLLELVDIFDELQDLEVLKLVQEGRKAVKRRTKGIPVSRLFDRLRSAK